MKLNYTIISLILFLFIGCTESKRSFHKEDLQVKILNRLVGIEGDFAIAYKDINDAEKHILSKYYENPGVNRIVQKSRKYRSES